MKHRQLEEMTNEELLTYIETSYSPAAIKLVEGRRSAFWERLRLRLIDLQHTALAGGDGGTRDAVGALLDETLWIMPESNGEAPLGVALIARLVAARRKIEQLEMQLEDAEELLEMDDEIFKEAKLK